MTLYGLVLSYYGDSNIFNRPAKDILYREAIIEDEF